MSSDSDPLEAMTVLARELTGRLGFDETLDRVVTHAAVILGVPRVSLRLLDATRTSLIAVTRAGQPLHDHPQPFDVGEGFVGWIVENNALIRCGDALADPRFVHRPGMRHEIRSFLGVPLTTGAVPTGVLSAVSPEPDYFTVDHERLAHLLAAIASPWLEVARLSRLSTVDPLTGALNRRGLEQSFPQEEDEAPDDLIEPLSVVMADLDHFKQVNDTHGHAAGDEVLRAVTSRLAELLRVGDAVVRYGGEEILLVLPGAGLEDAVRVAERARASLANVPIRAGDAAIAVTASFGVAERERGESRDAVIARADRALYEAKESGRNQVCST